MTDPIKVLLVEDEMLIGMDIAATLEDQSFEVHGPFKSCDEAIEVFETVSPDLGILDVQLQRGETSEPLAERFRASGKPFLFLSGSAGTAPEIMRFPEALQVSKPVDTSALISAVQDALEPSDTKSA